jgi:hypothetical protein
VAAREITSIANVKGDDWSLEIPVARTRRLLGANVAYTNKVGVDA